MCNVISIPSVSWLRCALRRWRARRSTASATVPSGHVAVCAEGARFMVRLAHLSHPAFLELLRQAEEEYGFPSGASGPVALPCDEDRLRDVLRRVSSSSDDSEEPCRTSVRRRRRRGDSRPLLQGVAAEKLFS
ncbi:auxin-responsive protein SAUR21-like [Hordeum vulgare subsp. vulgare]|uniref:Auxin-responsive protein n=1 Tax=Hordeum vulgare subsp. vulgare TaxID=112509 RepID=A0A8I6WTJ8_HORVV|nr:auxin-responsive protein SAUR21-like [Hordeum vulgare subsp. vulgare]